MSLVISAYTWQEMQTITLMCGPNTHTHTFIRFQLHIDKIWTFLALIRAHKSSLILTAANFSNNIIYIVFGLPQMAFGGWDITATTVCGNLPQLWRVEICHLSDRVTGRVVVVPVPGTDGIALGACVFADDRWNKCSRLHTAATDR